MKITQRHITSVGLLILGFSPFASSQVVSSTPVAPNPSPSEALPTYVPAKPDPQPPKVVCTGDQLSISANNATLQAILELVRGCSGARIEIPDAASRARTYEELGPGPMRRVLDELLSGTDFNYVIQSSEGAPQRVESVTVMARKPDDWRGSGSHGIDSPATEIAMTPARKNWQRMQKFDKPDPSDPEQGLPSFDQASAQPSLGSDSSFNTSKPAEPADASPSSGTSPTADGKSPHPVNPTEDKINSMQQLFGQRRDMIQKQNAASASPQNPAPN